MENLHLKNSLFGYNKSEVYDFISRQDAEYYEQLSRVNSEHEKAQAKMLEELNASRLEYTKMREQMESYREEYQKNLDSLKEDYQKNLNALKQEYQKTLNSLKLQNEQLLSENEQFRENQESVANVLLVAQAHSEYLQKQAEENALRIQEKKLAAYDRERGTIRDFASKIDDMLAQFREVLSVMDDSLVSQMEDLSNLDQEILEARARCESGLSDEDLDNTDGGPVSLESITAEEYELLLDRISPEDDETGEISENVECCETGEDVLLEAAGKGEQADDVQISELLTQAATEEPDNVFPDEESNLMDESMLDDILNNIGETSASGFSSGMNEIMPNNMNEFSHSDMEPDDTPGFMDALDILADEQAKFA